MEVERIKGTNQKLIIKKIKVCAYARVSTDMEKQETSFESQKIYYKNKIENNPNWEFVGIYSDRGISGLSTDNRNGFNRMIKDAYDGKIDLILTKNVSRFARNTIDMLETIRKLKEHNVNIYFEEEMVGTGTLESEMILTALVSVAQMESEVTSTRIRTSRRMKVEMNKPIVFKDYIGYKRKNNKLIINKKEAELVKEIFNRVIAGEKYGKIANDLMKRKIKNVKGGNRWYSQLIKNIITNRVYVGDYIVNSDKYRKEIFNTGTWQEYTFIDHHKAIIDKETFEKANKVLNDTKNNWSNVKEIDSPFNKKVFCGYCNNRCIKSICNKEKGNYNWRCFGSYYKKDLKLCTEVLHIPDSLIRDSFVEIIKKIKRIKSDDLDYDKEIMTTTNKKNKTIQKYNQLVSSYINKDINGYLYRIRKKEIEEELESIRLELIDDINKETIYRNRNIIFKYIKELLNYYDYKEFNEDLFELIISKVKLGGYTPKGYRDKMMIIFVINNDMFELENIKNEVLLDVKYRKEYRYYNYLVKKKGIKVRKSINTRLIIENNERYENESRDN